MPGVRGAAYDEWGPVRSGQQDEKEEDEEPIVTMGFQIAAGRSIFAGEV